MIEECYEVVEAIDTENNALLREELGDVLFQVFFHAAIAEEEGAFSLEDVVEEICAKMIYRHPHVFGNVEAKDSQTVLANWETLKTKEKQRNTVRASMEAVPPMLPALMRAEKIAGKAMRDGYSFGTEEELWAAIAAVRPGEGDTREALVKKLARLTFLAAVLTKKLNGDLEKEVQIQTSEFIKQYENAEKQNGGNEI